LRDPPPSYSRRSDYPSLVRIVIMMRVRSPNASARRSRRSPVVVAAALVLLGLLATTARLDAPSDGSVLRLGWSTWHPDGVVVDVLDTPSDPAPHTDSTLHKGDLVIAIAGHRLADGLGGLERPGTGDTLTYDVVRDGVTQVAVRMEQPDPYPLLNEGWGNLIFVFALAGLAIALYLRRPDEPATKPLLILAAGLLGSTLTVVAGLPVLALATAGPDLWLFHLNVVGAYSVAWGAALAFTLLFVPDHPWLGARRRRTLTAAYATPLTMMVAWSATAALFAPNGLRWLGLVHAGQTAVTAITLVVVAISGLVAYRHRDNPLTRNRLRWLAGGGAVAGMLGIAGWHLPELTTGRHLLPSGALGLSALPFVAGIAVALRRHRLFDIERLANRSLVYAAVVAVLVAGYAAVVALLVSGLRISGTAAAALAAAGAALALAPLRNAAQGAVNRLMYGDRTDPTSALARLGTRLHAVMLPGDVLPAVVETVAKSLRVPYVGIELGDDAGGFQVAAEHGVATGTVHSEPLLHHGSTVGRLRVSARGRDDPLDEVDLALIGTLAKQVGVAVQAVRLHEDLVRSRAQVVALREDERRRLRRDLHDGLGPGLAAIGLKAGLASRDVATDSAAHGLLNDIATEVKAGIADIRRLVEELRPPALDELGLVGAVRSRAAAMAGEMSIEVSGSDGAEPLPAAVETAAFRIAVEAMTNAVRHSGGRCCAVSIAIGDRGVDVIVKDDGAGLEPTHAVGVGLRSMRERAAELGGALSVGSPSEGGTVVQAWLPYAFGAKR
jgi:signal transduction histidine kinase